MPTEFEKCRLCLSLGSSDFSEILNQIDQSANQADLIEIRLDKFLDKDISSLSLIAQRSPCPLIWTLRKASHGGDFRGTEEERYSRLESILINLQPAFMDIEADTSIEMIHALQKVSPRTQWIISWHDFEKTPDNLDLLFEKLSRIPGTYYKIATFAQSTTDALRMLNFTKKINQKENRLCGICMGEYGISTRILSPIVGQPFTYASPGEGKEVAPGQLSVNEMIQVYRFRELDQRSVILGLIGNPVDKSLSHLTHNPVLKKLSINGVYLKFHVNEREFDFFFQELETLSIVGLSVTMPYKEKVLSLIESQKELVACNTLIRTADGWMGENTDGVGALRALGFSSFHKRKILIIGAGGTAKAIAAVAHQEGAQLAILNRTVDRAKAIAAPLDAIWGGLDRFPTLVKEGFHCIVQATSVGMAPEIEKTPIPSDWIIKDLIALDVISNPPETRFLSEIKKQRGVAISGRELFLHQAVAQFTCWFGSGINQDEVEQTIRQHLSCSSPSQSYTVRRSQLSGHVSLPASKSHTIRSILLAAFTQGISHIHHPLNSPDAEAAVDAARLFGAKVTSTPTGFSIAGVAGNPCTPNEVIDVGNSGQVLRFAAALGSLGNGYVVLTGDASIRSNRPVQPLIDGLKKLQGWAVSTRENGMAPFIVKGPLKAGKTSLDGEDSQPVSALLMASAFSEGKTEIHVQNAGEKPWIALTLSWLDRLGVKYTHHHFEHFFIEGKKIRPSFEVTIPGDLSSLAFPLAAALVTRSSIVIEKCDLTDVQGDKALVFLLQKMGASLEIDPSLHQLKVLPNGYLKGEIIDVNDFIDAVPILAVLGCYAEGETEIVNGAIARKKESNRLTSITLELKKMGASIEETNEGLIVKKSSLRGTRVNSHGDHRIAMSLIVAGLGADGETIVEGIDCINKSYPTFLADLNQLII